MQEPEYTVFSRLYREAYLRCFRKPLVQTLTETESKLFYQQILNLTGLTIGWRSLKNYSLFILNDNKEENPSVASMDTLARYVLKAPYTTEITRKNEESHHPYWFLYRDKHLSEAETPKQVKSNVRWISSHIALVLLLVATYIWYHCNASVSVIENFKDLSEKGLQDKGWQILNKDNVFWAKRNIHANALTLFTLGGDNWPDGNTKPVIKNLLIRPLPAGCFTTELQMEDFIPAGEWQQAGLLLLEDTTLNSPSIRISLAYNDFFGGFNKPSEVIVQAISAPGLGGKPEEFVHFPVLTFDSTAQKPVLLNNLKHTALRIEKQGKHYRFLYAIGSRANSAFKELAAKDFTVEPRYVAVFALKGTMPATQVVQVMIKKFLLQSIPCK